MASPTHLGEPICTRQGRQKGFSSQENRAKRLCHRHSIRCPFPPGHEIHDKFIVCGLNTDDPVVYCGSSNLASGGEAENSDNLLEIHDAEVATAFAIEALLLVDHYNFLDRYATPKGPRGKIAKKKMKIRQRSPTAHK
jgi:hypothetical protein